MSRDPGFWYRRVSRRALIKAGAGGVAGAALGTPAGRVLAAPATLALHNEAALGALPVAKSLGDITLLAATPAPLLVIVGSPSGNPFGGYLDEVLRAEGVRDYELRSMGELNAGLLAGRRVVILGESSPSSAQISALQDFVSAGGGLVAMRPDPALAGLLGIAYQGGTYSNAYFRITDGAIGGGLYSDTMQFHGDANRFGLNGASQVAQIYSDRSSLASSSAVTINSYGSGRAAMFAFDVARSVVLTRQGNPANANVDVDGDGVLRTIDLYNGWVDRERSAVPQADMLQRLLVRVIEAVSAQPVPRLWYFPGSSLSVFIPTGDAHANPIAYYQREIDAFLQRGVRMTFYLTTAAPDNSYIQDWRSQGFDFAVHPYADNGIDAAYSDALAVFQNRYGYTPRTARTHMIRWSGWDQAASIESQHSVEMDFNMYQWGTWLNRPGGAYHGYITGSGLPMRFASASGAILPIYQQHTSLVDEELAPEVGVAQLDGNTALAISRQTIDESVGGYHTAIATQFHVDYFQWGGVNAWVLGTVDYALQRGLPVLHADDWLTFVKQRAATAISGSAWNAGTLAFTVAGGGGSQTMLVPAQFRGSGLTQVRVNGSPTSYQTMTVNGVTYAALPATSGAWEVRYSSDSVPPVISGVNVQNVSNSSARVAWTTDEASTSLVDFGAGGTLNQQAGASGMTNNHTVDLVGLQPSTQYSYRATSVDGFGNSASSGVLTFTTAAGAPPTLTSVSPSSGSNAAAQSVTLTGSNFASGAVVRLSSTDLSNVQFVGSTSLIATVPAGFSAGTYDVTVVNTDGGSATLTGGYTVTSPAPTLTGVSPATVSQGGQVTLTGTGFASGATVRVGGTVVTSSVPSSTSATATVPSGTPAGVYDVSIANPDSQTATLSGALTVTTLFSVSHTTAADFGGGTLTSTQVLSGGAAGDGAVALASTGFTDAFDGGSLNGSNWATGLWDAAGSVAVSGGQCTIAGAWIHGLNGITAGSVTARLAFPNSPWQNFGLSRPDTLDNPWILFGVPGWDTSRVYARINVGSTYAEVPLTGLTGSQHDYTIEYHGTSVRFLVDGALVHQAGISNAGSLVPWASVGVAGAPLIVDAVSVASYASSGSFLSGALNAGTNAHWVQLSAAGDIPAGASLQARARSSANGQNFSNWTGWSSTAPFDLPLPDGAFLQYELALTTGDASVSPLIASVTATYQGSTGSSVGSVSVSPSAATLAAGGTQQFTATILDTQGQPIPGASASWSVVAGGGAISSTGLFTAGSAGGSFPNTVVATYQGVSGSASVTVSASAPTVTSITPTSGSSSSSTPVTISGTNFQSGAAASLGSTALSGVQVVDAATLQATVPSGMAAGVYDLIVTNPDGGSATLPGAFTVNAVTSLPSITHTTLADFSAGTPAGTQVVTGAAAGDGAVALASTGFRDEFQGGTLDANTWDNGLYDPSGSVTVGGDACSVNGGWIRGRTGAASASVTARVTFAASAWQNIGFSRADALDTPWLLFGVPGWDTSRVYVRVNVGSAFADVPLTGLVGAPHDYTIEYRGTSANFLVDGVLVHQATFADAGVLSPWFSVGAVGTPLIVEVAALSSYGPNGTFAGATMDAGQAAHWVQLISQRDQPAGTTLRQQARTSPDGAAWSDWSSWSNAATTDLTLPDGRFLQYALELTSADSVVSPLVQAVTASYQSGGGGSPQPATVTVSPGSSTLAAGATQQFSATILDAQGQPISGAGVTWSVVNGGGSISSTGLFTAGAGAGTFTNTVVATSQGATGAATVAVNALPPSLTSVTPTSGPTTGGTAVTISGSNFQSGAAVRFGSNPATNVVVTSGSISATTPAGQAGLSDVIVTNPDGGSATLSGGFQYVAPLAVPTVTGLSPTSGSTSGGTTVVITGTDFTGATAVRFGGNSASFTIDSNTQITAIAPARSSGTVNVRVTTPLGQSPTSAAGQFTYVNPPNISGLSPTSGPAAGGTTVTISGSAFNGATSVSFGTVAATSFTVVSNSRITAVSPPQAAGRIDVRVTTPYGQSQIRIADRFTYR